MAVPAAPSRLPYLARPTVEQLASLSEEEAYRRRCDARNFRVVRLTYQVSLVAAAIELAQAHDGLGTALAVAAALFAIVVLLVLRRIDPFRQRRSPAALEPAARRAVASFRASILIALALEATLLVAYSAHKGSAVAWLVILPFFVIWLRLLPSEAMLLHGFLLALAFASTLVPQEVQPEAASTPRRARRFATAEPIWPAFYANALALGVGLLATRRYRQRVLNEWRGQREGAREQIRMREELEFARQVQLSMLPAAGPTLEWLDVAGVSVPATEVGGDYFDYFPLGPDRLAVASADVAGHGLASGLVLSGLRSCLALLSDELGEPAEVARQLDLMVRRTTSHRMLVTLVIALFDRAAGSLTVTSAGHPPLLKRARDANRAEAIEFSSLPLGTKLSGPFAERKVPLAAGDLFLLYTDGLYEAAAAGGEPYGLDRLTILVGRLSPELSAAAVCDAILADLSAFTGRACGDDDITVVAVRVLRA